MVSICIYAIDEEYLEYTINNIRNKTSGAVEIFIRFDAPGIKLSKEYIGCNVSINSAVLGRAKSWNLDGKMAGGDIVVFLRQATKLPDGWLDIVGAIFDDDDRCVVGAVTHGLNGVTWMLESDCWQNCGWRWDLSPISRPAADRSLAVLSSFLAVRREWFVHLGGFDDGMGVGGGEDVELSLRSWLFGGSVRTADMLVGSGLIPDDLVGTVGNRARMAELWLGRYASMFYAASGVEPRFDRLGNMVSSLDKVVLPVDNVIRDIQPELFTIAGLYDSAVGRSVAVVGDGPSLDVVSPALIGRHDVVIGVDYVGKLLDCDLVVSWDLQVVQDLLVRYANKLVVSSVLRSPSGGRLCSAVSVGPVLPVDMGVEGVVPSDLLAPICDCGVPIFAAIHLALLMRPREVVIYGLDNKLIMGKSHTSRIEYYNGGLYLPDSELTRQKFEHYESVLADFGKLAQANNIILLRVCHA